MTLKELERRLDWIEGLIATANPKDLPYLNQTYEKLLNRVIALDVDGKTEEEKKVDKPE